MMMGIPACQMKTLIHASNAPPLPTSQENRKLGSVDRRTSNISEVTSRIPAVMNMNMQI